jgi:hypothetical protein
MRQLFAVLLVACAPKPSATLSPLPPAPRADPYGDSLRDAMFPEPSEVVHDLLTLTPDNPALSWDAQGRVLMTTWSRRKYYPADPYQPGHTFELYGDTWFTTADEVANTCAGLSPSEAALRVEQYLGLPAGGGRDVFVQVWVDPTLLFRPCVDPDITQSSCPLGPPITVEDDHVAWTCDDLTADSHEAWLCRRWIYSYGASQPARNSPWTALGYTYDWSPDHPEQGATEFVAPAGSPVELHRVVELDAFCAVQPS